MALPKFDRLSLLTVDYAHVTDSTNFLFALLKSLPEFRGFIDVFIDHRRMFR